MTSKSVSQKAKKSKAGKGKVSRKQRTIVKGATSTKKYQRGKKVKFPLNVWLSLKRWCKRVTERHRAWLKRRPHRSFYLTRRRDSERSLKIPGYIAFSGQVWRMLINNKWLFLRFFLLYAALSAIIVGMLSQDNYQQLRETLNENSVGGFGKLLALFTGAASGSASSSLDATQQLLSSIVFLFGWVTLVWLLRQIMAGHKVKLRDGLYSAGSPILATFMILIIIIVQLLPLAVVLIVYSSLTGVVINTGIAIENMAAWCALAVISALTIYWLASSFIALIIVTLPGMYPWRAFKAASDMVVGRRLRIVYRLIFMALPLLLLWLVILAPVILIDDKLNIAWLPLVPITVLLLTTMTLMWAATYIYMLYRRIVDDDTKPAKR